MRRRELMRRRLLAITLVLTGACVVSADGPEDFKLARAIPADAVLAVHARSHDGQAFINQQWARVWEAVEKAHFERDIKRLLKALNPPDPADPDAFDNWWQQITDLLAGVEWSTLCEREMAFALKLEFPAPQWVFLMRPPTDKVASNFDGFAGILNALAELDPAQLSVTTEEQDGSTVCRLEVADAPLPIGLTVARYEDVLLVAFGTTMVDQSLAMLRGGEGAKLADTSRFQEAFKQLPAPVDGLFFLDIAKLMTQLRPFASGLMNQAVMMDPDAMSESGEPDPKLLALPDKLIDAFDMFEYSAAVSTTDGMRKVSDSIVVLRDDAKSRLLYPVFFGNPPVSDPFKYIPKNASEFGVWNGIDLAALYRAIVKFVEADVPGGEELIAGWNAQWAESEYEFEQDFLAWIGGGLSKFSIAGPTPYAPGEFVITVTVRDDAKARTMLDLLFENIEPFLTQQSGAISAAEIAGTEGFRSILHPALGMVGLSRPTIGVKDGVLFLGSSPKVIQAALAVAAGEAPGFADNERYKKEGLPPAKNVTSLSFTDLSSLGEQLQQVVSVVPMMMMMGGGQALQGNRGAKVLLNMLTKLGPVVRKLDFFQSSCAQSTFDGKVIYAKSVTNYREPPKKKPRSSGNEPAEETDEATEKTEGDG